VNDHVLTTQQQQTFPHFPTFPVVHKFHLQANQGQLLPSAFINQDGDPFLFELYRRFGSARILPDVKLLNSVGGKFASRYEKIPIRFHTTLLNRSLQNLSLAMPAFTPIICLDVVVPTFRCDIDVLSRIVSLKTSIQASIGFVLVVDQPHSPLAQQVKILERLGETNYRVQVILHPQNLGASAARNTGLQLSKADYVLFLDDDVFVDEFILDAYLGAIMRRPQAKLFVGLTELPKAQTLMQRAMEVSQVTYFYDVARKMRHPSWGTTANLVVKARTNMVRFDLAYPRTGGGEDVDFCLRVKNGSDSDIVAVEGAKVVHPWWADGLRHVLGWAEGDSLCVDKFPQSTYCTLPNWIETVFCLGVACLAGWMWTGMDLRHTFVESAVVVLGLDTALSFRIFQKHSQADMFVCLMAALIRSSQQGTRFWFHLRRGRLLHNCGRRMDFFAGQENRFVKVDVQEHFVRFSLLMAGIIAAHIHRRAAV
jgi:hypothetical protein